MTGSRTCFLLNSHASHVTFEVIELAKSLNIEPFQLPSHSSHISQPLDVAAIGVFKREVTSVLGAFERDHRGKMPVNVDMVAVIRDAWELSLTPSQIRASFGETVLWPVDMARAVHRQRGRGSSRKARPGDRPPLADLPIATSLASLGGRAYRTLVSNGHGVTEIRVNTVIFGEFLVAQERVTRPSISRRSAGITKRGLLICDEVIEKYKEDERQRKMRR